MAVDFDKPPRILVVHGVQLGDASDLHQDETLRETLEARLGNIPFEFSSELYKYEDLNDRAKDKLKALLILFQTSLIARAVLVAAIDVIGDVVINLANGSTAHQIRKGLKDRILQIHDQGEPLFIVAHSLGSIYAFDVVNALMKDRRFFDRSSRETWPVQGLVTIGSPIGLSMFKRNGVTALGAGTPFFNWRNFWNRTDPVVSGSFYGKPRQGYEITERFAVDQPGCGWFIRDTVVDMGKVWLPAHVAYWTSPVVGDQILELVSR